MKRISTLLLSAAMAFGAVGAAQAIDLKASGTWDFAFGYAESSFDRDGSSEDTFKARQRIRPQFNFIASESLQGVLMFEIGTMEWGQGDNGPGTTGGARLDADGVNIETKRAYMDWIIPNTDVAVRMGIQGLALPSATGYGNPVFNADVAGIVSTAKISDMVDITGFWIRPFDATSNDRNLSVNNAADEVDAFGLVVPIKGEGWKVTPWGMYANIGNASGLYEYMSNDSIAGVNDSETTGAWWLGTGLEFQIIDNLTFATDVMYGKLNSVDIGQGQDLEASGWWLDAALNYQIENFGTAGLFGWYATGDSKDDGYELGRMPVIGTDGGTAFTSFGFPGSAGIGADTAVSNTATGTWGIGVQLADVSFIEDLSHTLRFAYYEGTNNRNSSSPLITTTGNKGFHDDNWYLTTRDSAFEVNFDHKYQIYENLAAYLELGYINLDLGNSTANSSNGAPDDAWKAQVLFQYKF